MKDIYSQLELISSELNMPVAYKEDLAQDAAKLAEFEGCDFVWLLRTYGTVLVPLRIGVDPVYVTHWLECAHGQKVVPFHIHGRTGVVEKITCERAEFLANQLPFDVSILDESQELAHKVEEILQYGCNKRIWGVFQAPESVDSIGNFNDWRNYFNNIGNNVMKLFMSKVVKSTICA